jgi:hypothetical protein
VSGLRTLSPDALRLWGDPSERGRAIDAILSAWQAADPALTSTVKRIDDAVVEGLRALALPRGLVLSVSIDLVGRGWLGRKLQDSNMVFDGLVIAALPPSDRPDTVYKTWIHESLHARGAVPAPRTRDSVTFPGYEEGMVEGLARLITRDMAGMRPTESAHTPYVQAYQTLAQVIGCSAEQLWRALWRYPRGYVHTAFADTIDQICITLKGTPLTALQRNQLRGTANDLFHRGFSRISSAFSPDIDEMTRKWTAVFP